MKTQPLVSIVLPVYNGERYISSAIESVLVQSYRNWELIVINDCSVDGTLPILLNFASKDDRIKVFTNEHNLKLPRSLNEGFRRAKGELLTWTSDDNLYREDAIAVMAEELENNRDLSLVYCDYTSIDSEGRTLDAVRLKDPEWLTVHNVVGACFMYTREAYERLGEYDPDMFLAEDYEYWLRFLVDGRIGHIRRDMYQYRLHEASLTETKATAIRAKTLECMMQKLDLMLPIAQETALADIMFDKMLSYARDDERQLLKKELIVRRPAYKKYLRIRAFKRWAKSTLPGKMFLKLKGNR